MSWNATAAIRARREMLGMSQSEMAKRLGVSKSLLSLIEAGSRQPTEEQIAKLADALVMPIDLLVLGLGRLPNDVSQAFELNPASCVAAIRSRNEAKAVNYPSTPPNVPLPKPRLARQATRFLPERIDARKTSTSYRAHSYHTKVPPEAITPFIRAFTKPGDLVCDPFCGSGMTGVAALMEGRNALLSDLSPAAVHIARNYTAPCEPNSFAHALEAVERAVSPMMHWLYKPLKGSAIVEYTTWSDVYRCPACQQKILYWDAVKQHGGTDRDGVTCTSCSAVTRKADLEWIGEEPVQSHTSSGSNRITTHSPTREELALIEESNNTPIPYWTPNIAFGSDREMWRAAHSAMGVHNVSDFFTKRNLHALAALRHAITKESDGRVREALMFAFTAAVNRASKRYQWNAKRPTNVMTGTLYISSLRYEWNVWSLFRRKAADVLRYYRAFPMASGTADVFQHSAATLDCIPDQSVDMVFMDPPFGSNIFYADSSFLWDAWLGELTNQSAEIVINKHRKQFTGGKNLADYADLMTQSFAEAARILKKGGRAVLAFSNSDDRVWQSIQQGLQDAGFDTETVHVLNKGQPSIKGVKGRTGKEQVTTLDLMLCLKHKKLTSQLGVTFAPPLTFFDKAIREHFASVGTEPQLIDQIYSAVIRNTIQANYSVAGITMRSIAERCRALGLREKNHRWSAAFTAQPAPAQDFVAGYLANGENLPDSDNTSSASDPVGSISAAGGRGSAFYLAHSYHTKVPPEAITPFIEHYTKPGDVVLDPFCGSGMTGVAAALAGRRCILSDLSPAAIHLAWNHTRPCDPEKLEAVFVGIKKTIKNVTDAIYRTQHTDGSEALIHWTLWSTKHRCPKCSGEFLLWEAMDRETGRMGTHIDCPRCKKDIRRSSLETIGSVPAWIAYETKSGKRFEKAPDTKDIKHAVMFERDAVRNWYPTTPIAADREMYIRCALQLHRIGSIPDFYTPRNLQALALIWHEIQKVQDERIKRALAFAFTNTAWHGTRMRRFNARGGQRPLTGTLYIPQLSSEANVLEVMSNKIAQLKRYYRIYQVRGTELPSLLLNSAAKLAEIKDSSVDYVFTDPPFGSNIFYADCNLIWESWLGRLTDTNQEAVVNRSLAAEKGGKTLKFYSGLMAHSMKEIARVLKPGGWATVVFHNTDAAVWEAIRDAASNAGFEFHEAASLNRKQQSHKGYKGRSGVEDVAHFDVVFNLRRPLKARKSPPKNKRTSAQIRRLVLEIANKPEFARRGLQGVHAEVMRQLASRGGGAFVDYSMIRHICEEQFEAAAE